MDITDTASGNEPHYSPGQPHVTELAHYADYAQLALNGKDPSEPGILTLTPDFCTPRGGTHNRHQFPEDAVTLLVSRQTKTTQKITTK